MDGDAAVPLAPPDRAAIDDLLARYCFAIDLRDWEGLREVFARDAVITYSGPRVSAGIDQIVEFFRSTTSAVAATQHLLHTSRVWAAGPDTAEGLSHVTAHHVGQGVVRPAPETATYTVTGTYHDRFARTGEGWRIACRTLTLLTCAGDPAILDRR
jgi:SnoaL-like domain